MPRPCGQPGAHFVDEALERKKRLKPQYSSPSRIGGKLLRQIRMSTMLCGRYNAECFNLDALPGINVCSDQRFSPETDIHSKR